jgi:hypothetical protein
VGADGRDRVAGSGGLGAGGRGEGVSVGLGCPCIIPCLGRHYFRCVQVNLSAVKLKRNLNPSY